MGSDRQEVKLTREVLESIPSIRRRIARLKEKLHERPVLSGLHYSVNNSHGNGTHSELEGLVIWRNKIIDKIIREYARLSEVQVEIYDFIRSLESEKEKEVVEMYCIDGLTFEEIGKKIHCSRSTVQRLYYQAISRINN